MSETMSKVIGAALFAALITAGVSMSSDGEQITTRNASLGIPEFEGDGEIGGGLAAGEKAVAELGDAMEAARCKPDQVLLSTGDPETPWRCGPFISELATLEAERTLLPNSCSWLKTWHGGFSEMIEGWNLLPDWEQNRMLGNRALQDNMDRLGCVASFTIGTDYQSAIDWFEREYQTVGIALGSGEIQYGNSGLSIRLIPDETRSFVADATVHLDPNWLDRNYPMGG